MGTWTPVYSAHSLPDAELVRGRLEAHDITAVIMDHQPSMYPSMGSWEVLVDRDDAVRAIHLIATTKEE